MPQTAWRCGLAVVVCSCVWCVTPFFLRFAHVLSCRSTSGRSGNKYWTSGSSGTSHFLAINLCYPILNGCVSDHLHILAPSTSLSLRNVSHDACSESAPHKICAFVSCVLVSVCNPLSAGAGSESKTIALDLRDRWCPPMLR